MWTAIIYAHNICGYAEEALHLFHEMQKAGVGSNERVYLLILSVIAESKNLMEGRRVHAQIMVILVVVVFIRVFTLKRKCTLILLMPL